MCKNRMEQEHQFIDYIEQSIIKNWDKDALTDYKGITLQYKDVARKIAKFHIVLESAGIQPGDKIADIFLTFKNIQMKNTSYNKYSK